MYRSSNSVRIGFTGRLWDELTSCHWSICFHYLVTACFFSYKYSQVCQDFSLTRYSSVPFPSQDVISLKSFRSAHGGIHSSAFTRELAGSLELPRLYSQQYRIHRLDSDCWSHFEGNGLWCVWNWLDRLETGRWVPNWWSQVRPYYLDCKLRIISDTRLHVQVYDAAQQVYQVSKLIMSLGLDHGF